MTGGRPILGNHHMWWYRKDSENCRHTQSLSTSYLQHLSQKSSGLWSFLPMKWPSIEYPAHFQTCPNQTKPGKIPHVSWIMTGYELFISSFLIICVCIYIYINTWTHSSTFSLSLGDLVIRPEKSQAAIPQHHASANGDVLQICNGWFQIMVILILFWYHLWFNWMIFCCPQIILGNSNPEKTWDFQDVIPKNCHSIENKKMICTADSSGKLPKRIPKEELITTWSYMVDVQIPRPWRLTGTQPITHLSDTYHWQSGACNKFLRRTCFLDQEPGTSCHQKWSKWLVVLGSSGCSWRAATVDFFLNGFDPARPARQGNEKPLVQGRQAGNSFVWEGAEWDVFGAIFW